MWVSKRSRLQAYCDEVLKRPMTLETRHFVTCKQKVVVVTTSIFLLIFYYPSKLYRYLIQICSLKVQPKVTEKLTKICSPWLLYLNDQYMYQNPSKYYLLQFYIFVIQHFLSFFTLSILILWSNNNFCQ